MLRTRGKALSWGYAVLITLLGTSGYSDEKVSDLRAYCEGALSKLQNKESKIISSNQVDPVLQAKLEEHTLEEVVSTDFVEKHPWMVMDAAQTFKALDNYAGVSEMNDPDTGQGKIVKHNLYSAGSALTDHMRIVGHYRGIEKLMNSADAAARGDVAGVYPPLLVGPPGTGKSVALTIPTIAYENVTLLNPEMFVYSFEWKNLDKIHDPMLVNLFEVLGKDPKNPLPCPIHDTPLVLLPKAMQDHLIAKAAPFAKKQMGYAPIPKRDHCPQCSLIQHRLLAYLSEEAGHKLTISESVEELNKYVTIRRRIMGENGSAALIPAQTKDVDIPSIFMGKNAASSILGADHPFSYDISGKVPQNNGGLILWDEVLKNKDELKAKLLNYIQSRTIAEGGAPTIPVNVFNMLATNTAEVKKLKSEDPQSPFLSRSNQIQWLYSIKPDVIAKTVMYDLPSLNVSKLGEDNAPIVDARTHLDEIMPLNHFGDEVVTSENRYNTFVGDGEDAVHISPQAIMFISEIASLTRQDFAFTEEQAQAQQIEYPVVSEPFFRDPVTRLKALMGQTNVTQSKAIQFYNLSKMLGEGSFGMDHRDLTKWLNGAISEAKKSNNGHCVTPTLLREVLESTLFEDPDFKAKATREEKLRILNYAGIVAYNFSAPAVERDVISALAETSDQAAQEIYDSVVASLVAKDRDPQTAFYIDSNNLKVTIRTSRINEIKTIYHKQTGRDLSESEIAKWHLEFAVNNPNGTKARRSSPLMAAIATYQAKKVLDAHEVMMPRFLRLSNGSVQGASEEHSIANEFVGKMIREHGYCPHCLHEATNMIAQKTEQEAAIEEKARQEAVQKAQQPEPAKASASTTASAISP